MKKTATLPGKINYAFEKAGQWFNFHFGWFFTNGNKYHRYTEECEYINLQKQKS